MTTDLAVAADCRPDAMSAVAVMLVCGVYDPPRLLLQPLAPGSAPRQIRLAGRPISFAVLSAGRRFALIERSDPAGPYHSDIRQDLIDLETGRDRNLSRDPFGARRVLDLDRNRSDPSRVLCKPLRRGRGYFARFAPARVLGGWLLRDRQERGSGGRVLQRCGSRKVRFSFSFGARAAANRRVVAYRTTSTVRVRQLRSGRLIRSIATQGTEPAAFALTEARLYVLQKDGSLSGYRL